MSQTTVSVRGTAARTVTPDSVAILCGISAPPADRDEVLEVLHDAQAAVIDALRRLGAVRLTVGTGHDELTWSFGGLAVENEHGRDPVTGEHGPTGRTVGSLPLTVALRSLTRLTEVVDALLDHDRVVVNTLQWQVDDDNAAWREVRAAAIAMALAKAGDYAAALGGNVLQVAHLADAGLLDGGRAHESGVYRQSSVLASGSGRGSGARMRPVLEPVPQQIQAVVDARVIADVNDGAPDVPPN